MQDVPDQLSGTSHHDGYRLQIAPSLKHITATKGGVTLADSSNALLMRETRHAPVLYFPRDDVAMDSLVRTSQRTHCPFKGNASYWSMKDGDQQIENAAWSYESPYDEAVAIKDHIAFYWHHIDEWQADGEPLPQPARAETSLKNPLVSWLLEKSWQPKSIPEFLTEFAHTLRDNGFPLWRARLLIQTINPLLFARGFTWQHHVEGIEEFQATHAGLGSSKYQDSPFAAIINGEGGIRRRLTGPAPRVDFPILHELVAEGATDYVAVPMRFSDGQVNILVLVSDQPEGFTTDQLGHLYEILANLSRVLETHAQRTSSKTLLQTYLGQGAGNMVMEGLIKRGDAEELNAVIWMADLRDSTLLADQLPQPEYLAALNDYFDCVAGAVVDNGGDVLKFIGDAVLAIFPIGAGMDNVRIHDQALAAVTDAQGRLDVINTERAARNGAPPLRFGIGLHCDTLTFGNIGTPGRLDFTVIGAGVNKAARIAALCKDLDQSVIISETVANSTSAQLTSLGSHTLRGFRASQQLYTLG
jgi:adenylate cyclase